MRIREVCALCAVAAACGGSHGPTTIADATAPAALDAYSESQEGEPLAAAEVGAVDSSAVVDATSGEADEADATNVIEAEPPDGSIEDEPNAADAVDDVAHATDASEMLDTQMKGKMLFGYQGWFACPGDGSSVNGWQHWLQGPKTFQVDLWPDLSEFSAAELFAMPGITMPDGGPSVVFSAYPAATVMRHFKWMHDYGLDGALLQRFLGEVQDPVFFAFRNQVAKNVMAAAQAQGRVFAIEYDLSGVADADALPELEKDWMALVDTLGVLDSPRALMMGAKPVLFVWGLGFPDRAVTPATAAKIIAWLQAGAPERYRVAVVGGVPSSWRTLDGDSSTDPAWAPVFRSLDVVSPWSVGRFSDLAGADQYQKSVVQPDIAELTPLGVGYIPVVFPGFSWHNLNGGPLNQIPRNGGTFYWRQVYDSIAAGATMVKTAMFDEMNEGTAMLKMQPTTAGVPTQASFVTLDIDGQSLRSDHYLSLAGAATVMLHGGSPLTATMPTVP